MKKLIIVLSLLFWMTLSAKSQQLYINELMASNNQAIADGTGAYEDWFEVYNPNSFSVNIGGYYVTDNLSNPTKYRFPTGSSATIVPANGFLLVWASGVTTRGANHISFSLSAGGEQIGLYRLVSNVLEVVDSLSFGPQRSDISWGRQPNGSSTWLYFQASTNNISPGASNNNKTGYALSLAAPGFSQSGGFYTTGFNLALGSTDTTATIYYTLDGSDPNPTNPNSVTFAYKNSYPELPNQAYGSLLKGSYQTHPYSTTLAISDPTSSSNVLSVKSSTWNFSPGYFPIAPVFKGTIVRAIAYKANAIPSDIITQTYFVTPTLPRYSIPVVSIALNEKHLFDYNTGIYTAGVTFDNFRALNPTTPANYCTVGNFSNSGDDWERPGNIEFFINNASVINQSIGLRIHGGCSRTVARKSLRLYGSSDFEYPFFDNRPASVFYNRLILRNGGNDSDYTTLVDVFGQRMVRHLPFDTQSSSPSALFLNGEYWGIHNLVERYDEYYINRNYGIATDSVDMVDVALGFAATAGDLTSFSALKTYFTDTNPVSYSYIKTRLDVENFADYQIAEIFAANTDWPANNVTLWRKRTSQYLPNAPRGHDGRWRWMLRDLDFGLTGQNYAQTNTFITATNTISQYAEFTVFFRRLLDIPDFKKYFINRYADLLNTTFHPSRTVPLLDSLQQQYQPYMPEHFDRWRTGTTYANWLTNMGNINNFLQIRPDSARKHIQLQFGLTTTRSLTINVSNTAQGYVKVNTIDILPTTVGVPATTYPWTGVYFQGNAINIVAKAKSGYKFLYWKESTTIISTDTAYSFDPTTNRSLLAVFDLDDAFNSTPASYSLLACDYKFTNWPASSPAGTYPANMLFVMMNQEDPTLAATISNTVTGAYNYTSRTRINGLGDAGFSIINTGNSNTNPGYVASTLGGVLLALRTTGLNQAYVQWTAGTVTPNVKQYRIRLRYRIRDSGPFTDLLDSLNNPVEYVRNATAGHSQVIGPTALPDSLLNRAYVQLLWQYYWTGAGTNARDELRIDDIIISRGSCESLASDDWNLPATWSCGHVPTSCDAVKINDGHSVTISIPNAVAKRVQFGANAQLIYDNETAALLIQPGN